MNAYGEFLLNSEIRNLKSEIEIYFRTKEREPMKVLVTGGTGFTGKALVRRLLDEGHHVVALDYKEGLKTEELRKWGTEVVIGSVTDKNLVDRCTEGVDVVHHLAAAFRELNVPDSYYHEVNVGGTLNALEAAYRHKVKKFIYCSTCGVHGNIDHPPGGEDAPIQPADYYQTTKYEAEPLVHEFYKKGMKTVILRFGPESGAVRRRIPDFINFAMEYIQFYAENQ